MFTLASALVPICADVPSVPFEAHLLNDEDGNVHTNMQARFRAVPGVPYADLRSRRFEGAVQAIARRNIWDPNGAELEFYWPAHVGSLTVNTTAMHPGLSLALNGTDAANFTVSQHPFFLPEYSTGNHVHC